MLRPPFLEYSSYPHIVDRILVFADIPTLMAARLTCRRLCSRADRIVSSHVAVATSQLENRRRSTSFDPVLRQHRSATRVLDVQWVEGEDYAVIEMTKNVMATCPNLKLVRVFDQQMMDDGEDDVLQLVLDATHTADIVAAHPTTSTVHFNNLAGGASMGILATAVAYGGGDVFVNIRYTGDHGPLAECKVLGLGEPTDPGQRFYFFLTTAEEVPSLTRARTGKAVLAPLIAAFVEQIIAGSKAEFIVVRRPHKGVSAPKKPRSDQPATHPLWPVIKAELAKWQKAHEGEDGAEVAKRMWGCVGEQIRLMTFEEMKVDVGEEIYEQVMKPF